MQEDSIWSFISHFNGFDTLLLPGTIPSLKDWAWPVRHFVRHLQSFYKMNKSSSWNTFAFSRGFAYAFMRRSTQPVMFHHSSRGLGRYPNKHFAFVYTKALLAEACSWKRCDGIFWKNFSFLLYIKWDQQAMFVAIHCHELLVGVYPNPRFAQNILRLRIRWMLY